MDPSADQRLDGELPAEGLPPGWGAGRAGALAFGIAVAFSIFQTLPVTSARTWIRAIGATSPLLVRGRNLPSNGDVVN